MQTWELVNYIKNLLGVQSNSLSHMLDLKPATFYRYLKGKNDASFSETTLWMKDLHLNIINDKVTVEKPILFEWITQLNKAEYPGKYDDVISSFKNVLNAKSIEFIDAKFISSKKWRVFYIASREFIEHKLQMPTLKHLDEEKLESVWNPSAKSIDDKHLDEIYKKHNILLNINDL